MFLRNHGMIACGKILQEVVFYCYQLELACKTQIAALLSQEELIISDEETCSIANYNLLNFKKLRPKRLRSLD